MTVLGFARQKNRAPICKATHMPEQSRIRDKRVSACISTCCNAKKIYPSRLTCRFLPTLCRFQHSQGVAAETPYPHGGRAELPLALNRPLSCAKHRCGMRNESPRERRTDMERVAAPARQFTSSPVRQFANQMAA